MEKERFVPLSRKERSGIHEAIAAVRYRREIREAVAALGYRQNDIIEMQMDYHSHRRWRVQIPGKLDGVYDLDRHTFVD